MKLKTIILFCVITVISSQSFAVNCPTLSRLRTVNFTQATLGPPDWMAAADDIKTADGNEWSVASEFYNEKAQSETEALLYIRKQVATLSFSGPTKKIQDDSTICSYVNLPNRVLLFAVNPPMDMRNLKVPV